MQSIPPITVQRMLSTLRSKLRPAADRLRTSADRLGPAADRVRPAADRVRPAAASTGAFLRREWKPATAIAGVLLIATAFVQPWSHTTEPAQMHPAADGTPAAVAPLSPSGTVSPVTPSPTVTKPGVPVSVAVNQTTTGAVWGKVPKISWPRTGQAGLALSGGGVLGVSGKQHAVPTASMAKAMTAYIVLRDHPLKGGSNGPTIHVTRAEAAVVGLNRRQDQQVLSVRSGEAITEKQAMDALLLKSANNVARILARWDAGSVDKFLVKMNATAKQLGMTNTHYTDPSGWLASTKSTTTDQMRLAEAAMARSDFARLVNTRSAWVPIEGRIRNVNALLGQEGIVGIKTGSMSAAGGCLMFAARQTVHGQTVTILGTVMGQRSGVIGDLHQAFASSKALVQAMHKVVAVRTIIKKGQVVANVPGTNHQLVASKTVNIVGWSGMKYTKNVKATVGATTKPGTTVGTLTITSTSKVSVPVTLK